MLPLLISSTEPSSTAPFPTALSLHENLPEATAGSFSVITYNIAGLPALISSAQTKRPESTAEIGRKLNRYDIAHVQEDFNYNGVLYKHSKHAYRTATKGKVLFGDGLNTLSRFPISETQRIPWEACTGADCLTPKGFTFTRTEVARGVFIDFYNVHANAYNHVSAAAARRDNIRQLSAFIQNNSADRAVIVMGDLNGRYAFDLDNIELLASEHGLTDSWVDAQRNGVFPKSLPLLPSSDILTITDSTETIDKILYRGSETITLLAENYRLEKDLFSNDKGQPLSDHHPVSARISWRLAEPSYLTQRDR